MKVIIHFTLKDGNNDIKLSSLKFNNNSVDIKNSLPLVGYFGGTSTNAIYKPMEYDINFTYYPGTAATYTIYKSENLDGIYSKFTSFNVNPRQPGPQKFSVPRGYYYKGFPSSSFSVGIINGGTWNSGVRLIEMNN